MSRTRKRTISKGICITLGLFVSVVFSFTFLYAKPPVKPSGELRVGVPTLLTQTFHPFWAPVLRGFYYKPFYDPLIGLNAKGNLDPEGGVAYRWKESPDHLSWIFWIRDGIRFHDGTSVTLEDVKYSLDTILDKKNVCARSLHEPYQERVEIVPPDKVVIHLKKQWPTMPYYLSPVGQGGGTILPKKYIEQKGDLYELHPIGTGPYKFLEKKEGDYIKLEAQDSHWRVGTPKYKYLTFKMLPEEGTREAALRSGEADLIQVGVNRANKLEAEGFKIHEKKGSVDIHLEFLRTYQSDNPLNKKEVRQALIYAINKGEILKHVLMGRGKLIGHVFQMYSWSISYKDYPVTPYDVQRAKQLLAEAGYPKGFTIYLYSFVTLVPEVKLINEAIAGYWKAIGMDVKIIELDPGAFFPIWMKKREPPGPAAHVHSFASRAMDPWRPHYHSDVEKFYFSQTKDRVMDQLIERYEVAVSMDEFIKADRACEERALEMFFKSAIASTSTFFASRKDTGIPEWDLGRAINCYRFEYLGATK